jgi:hypothetical protein
MERVTTESPPSSGVEVVKWPLTEVEKGTAGTPDVVLAAVEEWTLRDVPAEVEVVAFASCDSNAADVPERWDHPGRSGPTAANTAMVNSTTPTATAPASLRVIDLARPVRRRHTTAVATAPMQATTTNNVPGSLASVPDPRPCTTATGQHA